MKWSSYHKMGHESGGWHEVGTKETGMSFCQLFVMFVAMVIVMLERPGLKGHLLWSRQCRVQVWIWTLYIDTQILLAWLFSRSPSTVSHFSRCPISILHPRNRCSSQNFDVSMSVGGHLLAHKAWINIALCSWGWEAIEERLLSPQPLFTRNKM